MNMISDALERFRNSDGFACSDKTEDGVMEDLITLAQAYDSIAEDQGESESLRIANERVRDLEGGLTTIFLQFGEPYYSWQRALYRVQQLIRRRNACAEACLNAIGFLSGQSVMTKDCLVAVLADAVKPIVTNADEPPEFHQVPREQNVTKTILDAARIFRDAHREWDTYATWPAMRESLPAGYVLAMGILAERWIMDNIETVIAYESTLKNESYGPAREVGEVSQ